MARQIISVVPFQDELDQEEPNRSPAGGPALTIDQLDKLLKSNSSSISPASPVSSSSMSLPPPISSTPVPVDRPAILDSRTSPERPMVKVPKPVPAVNAAQEAAQGGKSVVSTPYKKHQAVSTTGSTKVESAPGVMEPEKFQQLVDQGMGSENYLDLLSQQQKLRDLYARRLSLPVKPDISPLAALVDSWYGTKLHEAAKPQKPEDYFTQLLKMQGPEARLQQLAAKMAALGKGGVDQQKVVTGAKTTDETGTKPMVVGSAAGGNAGVRQSANVMRAMENFDKEMKPVKESTESLHRLDSFETGDVPITPVGLAQAGQDLEAGMVTSGHLTDLRIKQSKIDSLVAQLKNWKQWATGETTDLREVPSAHPILRQIFAMSHQLKQDIAKAAMNRAAQKEANGMVNPDKAVQDASRIKAQTIRQQYEPLLGPAGVPGIGMVKLHRFRKGPDGSQIEDVIEGPAQKIRKEGLPKGWDFVPEQGVGDGK